MNPYPKCRAEEAFQSEVRDDRKDEDPAGEKE